MIDVLGFNKNELDFIKHYAIGNYIDVIKYELNLETNEKMLDLKKNIKKKLKVDSDYDMLSRAYSLKMFILDDYFLTNWQNIAFGTAYNIYLCEVRNENKGEDMKLIYVKILRIYVTIFKNHKNQLTVNLKDNKNELKETPNILKTMGLIR